jgi:hypothetical protein
MRSALLAAASAVFLASCGIGGPEYPRFGETAYRIEGLTTPVDGGAATRTVIYRDGPKMRVEAALPTLGQATIVFDESTSAAYVLNPTAAPTGAATTATPTLPSAAPATAAAPTPVAPAATAPAATGVAVRIEDADAPQPLETAWEALGAQNASSAGGCEVAGERGHQWRPRQETAGVERVACITDDGIVLRVSESGRVLWEATSLQRGEQDAALFGVPAGYQMIDPQRVAEQVGQNMEQLDSVTGAPAPQQAPDPRG